MASRGLDRPGWASPGLAWLATGLAMSLPLALVGRIEGLFLGLLGPLGILTFKPGENLGGKLVVVALAAAPALIVLLLLWRRGGRVGERGRLVWLAGASALWHGPAIALWMGVFSRLN